MTDGLDQALISAGLNLLITDPQLRVYDGIVPSPTPNAATHPYVVVYSSIERPSDAEDNTVDGRTRTWIARWICHCVGANAVASRAVAQRVRTQLLDVRPVVAGLACGLIRLESATPPQRDETTGTAVMDTVVTFRLVATN